MPGITFDTNINLEGAVAALGIMIAAIGYLVSLCKSALDKRKADRIRADDMLILEILEESPLIGLSEQEILQGFQSPEYTALGKRLGASTPRQVGITHIENRLLALQYDHFVDRTTSRKYVLRTGFEKLPDRERQREAELARRKLTYVQARTSNDKVLQVLSENFDRIDEWDRKMVLEAYSQLGIEASIEKLVTQLDSEEPKLAVSAAIEIARIVHTGERYADLEDPSTLVGDPLNTPST